MTFKTMGFSSPTMASYTDSLKAIIEYRMWFDYAESLVKLGIEMTDGHGFQPADKHSVTISALFFRSHKSFQAAILLSERGLIGDARTVLRSAAEGSIALFALATDPAFINSIEEAKHYDDRKKLRILIDDPENSAELTAEDIAHSKDTVKAVDELEAACGRKFRDINWADVARKKDADGNDAEDLYNLIYRALSSDGTHTTIDAISHILEIDLGRVKSLKVGPDISNLVQTLATACNIFLYALVAFDRSFGSKFSDKLQASTQIFAALPHDEPLKAKVTEHF